MVCVAFEVLAGATLVAGVIECLIVSQSSELKSISGTWQFIILGAIGWWNVFLAAIYLTMAQVLRFLARIAVAVSPNTGSTFASERSATFCK